eukprot:1752497-Heterocapsa_arctica.AAC.1
MPVGAPSHPRWARRRRSRGPVGLARAERSRWHLLTIVLPRDYEITDLTLPACQPMVVHLDLH